MRVYYNDSDPFMVRWLHNLLDAGLLPAGDVDSRPIQEVRPNDVRRYGQCHFFAGIGGWPAALELAGWGDAPVWSGSCPCQPFSMAGRRGGADDPRDLWRYFRRLIAECGPATVFGEQVDGPDGYRWLSGVRADLEAAGYAVGAANLPAASVAAPHMRQRLWWVADSALNRWKQGAAGIRGRVAEPAGDPPAAEVARVPARSSKRLGDPDGGGRHPGLPAATSARQWHPVVPTGSRVGDPEGARCPIARDPWETAIASDGSMDGQLRPVEPGVLPVADGVPGRVGLLRGYGNAVVPQVAATFIEAFLECRP